MNKTKKEATFVFANCAGAARGEKSDLERLGRELGRNLNMIGIENVMAVGLSEVSRHQNSLRIRRSRDAAG